MDEKSLGQDTEKTDLTYAENTPPEAGQDIHSYKHILLTQQKWAWPNSGWKMVAGWAIVVFGCCGSYFIFIAITRGWDGLLTLLGWK